MALLNKTLIINLSPTLPSSQSKPLFFPYPTSSNLPLPRVPPSLSHSSLCLARRRTNSGGPISSSNNKNKKSRNKNDSNQDNELDEDAFEALFKQLEEDLKNDDLLLDDGEDEISEEDLALLERELEEALAEDEDLAQLLNVIDIDAAGVGNEPENVVVEDDGEEEDYDDDDDAGDGDDDNEEEDEPVKLKGWQLRRLAHALKLGRRKTSIKDLAAELCLDRAIVLEMLRDPPPNLLMLSATLPDKPEKPVATVPSSEATTPSPPSEVTIKLAKHEPKVESPIHVLQGSWSARKRLKKAHINTLESVYRRTKRPTNAMISSIVQVTNLPRRKVVAWFEDKRAADGVPDQHRPYQRPSA